MDVEPFWQSEGITPGGHQLVADLVDGGVIVTVKQRQLGRDPKTTTPGGFWLFRAKVMVLWPSSLEHAVRLLLHTAAFYDQALQPLMATLFDKLAAMPDLTTDPPPQNAPPTAMN